MSRRNVNKNMDIHPEFMPKVFRLYLEISQYPILKKRIREQMRHEIFARAVIDKAVFENEVEQKAIESQRREGILSPLHEESAREWAERVDTIRSYLTDFYFAYNLPHKLFEEIVQDLLAERIPEPQYEFLSFNPELAPWDLLFSEGHRYEKLLQNGKANVQHHLNEIKAVIIKAMISDHLQFVGLARSLFTMNDLTHIRESRIGRGKIGGKATGMLIAWKIIQNYGSDFELDPSRFVIPESYFVGSDVVYEMYQLNEMHSVMNQKYKSPEEIIAEYPAIREKYLNADLPGYIVAELSDLLKKIGNRPIILRSSSLLEDSADTAFAGKYDSYFLPNQGSHDEKLENVIRTVLKIYMSTLNPDALLYRQRMNLIDFDERMAILIQPVAGHHHGRYFFPTLAGVGFSRNPFRWSPKIRREDGLLRLVCGLGTRAVDRVSNDYPRMVALSHPQLRPERDTRKIRYYSQRYIDVLDVEANEPVSLPITDVVNADFPNLRLLAVEARDGMLQPFITRPTQIKSAQLVFTFDPLVKKTEFPKTMRNTLACLETHLGYGADIEYAVDIDKDTTGYYFNITLLQCRPLSEQQNVGNFEIPADLPSEDIIFSSEKLVPSGVVENVRYIVFVKPTYKQLQTEQERYEVGRIVGRINQKLENDRFILMGPGRWGTSNIKLGVKVTYADIFNCLALIEIAVPDDDHNSPEMAYGTHFFQDLVESQIYPLALYPAEPNNEFDWDIFEEAPNLLQDLLPQDSKMTDVITVIDVYAVTQRYLRIVMDTEADKAVGYLVSQ